jgi:hypothetical protein
MKLLTPGISNAKIAKGEGEYTTYILHLAPADLSGYNTCPAASPGCKSACLNTAGRGRFDNVQSARIRKTKMFFENRSEFMRLLIDDIHAAARKAKRTNQRLCIRLNGTSDIAWEREIYLDKNVFEHFPAVQFYDYTKRPERLKTCAKYPNYRLTFSASEVNGNILKRIPATTNIAVVFRNALPSEYLSRPVIDGTTTDLRFTDPTGVIVGLVAKGKAKRDVTGFVKD